MNSLLVLTVLCRVDGLGGIELGIADGDWDIGFEFLNNFYFFLLSGCRLGDNTASLLC